MDYFWLEVLGVAVKENLLVEVRAHALGILPKSDHVISGILEFPNRKIHASLKIISDVSSNSALVDLAAILEKQKAVERVEDFSRGHVDGANNGFVVFLRFFFQKLHNSQGS